MKEDDDRTHLKSLHLGFGRQDAAGSRAGLGVERSRDTEVPRFLQRNAYITVDHPIQVELVQVPSPAYVWVPWFLSRAPLSSAQ